ncbi:MAG: hypothetical protein LR017_00900 [Candidatus Pacebacteria bacterium]|nr:hypothetical protein [Candidatus Paceibacterota bacterium]
MRKVVLFDNDDTLFPFGVPFINFHNDKYGTSAHISDFIHYRWHEVFGCSFKELYHRVHVFTQSKHQQRIKPLPGVARLIDHFLEREWQLVMVTSRPESHQSYVSMLYEKYLADKFVAHHYLGHRHDGTDEVTKLDIAKHYDATLMFDDAPGHFEGIAQLGMQGFMPQIRWNEDVNIDCVTPLIPEEGNEESMWDPAYNWLHKNG